MCSKVLTNERNSIARTNQSLLIRCWRAARSVRELIFCLFFPFFFLTVYTYIQSRFYRSPEVILGKWKFSFLDQHYSHVFKFVHSASHFPFLSKQTIRNDFLPFVVYRFTEASHYFCRQLLVFSSVTAELHSSKTGTGPKAVTRQSDLI